MTVTWSALGLRPCQAFPGTYQGYVLQFSGLSFIGYPITGEFYETDLLSYSASSIRSSQV